MRYDKQHGACGKPQTNRVSDLQPAGEADTNYGT